MKNFITIFFTWRKFIKNKRRVHDATMILRNIDRALTQKGVNRAQRRMFWRDFIHSEKTRETLLAQISEETK
jgi:hypothetical protein